MDYSFVTSMAIINLNFRRKKKILGYDLVYIDENNRFFITIYSLK